MTRVLTGIKPTGTPHLGNLVGAILPFIKKSQEEGVEPIIFIADLHALNSGISAESIQQSTKQIAATLLALGLDPEKVTFFRQSDIREVAVMKTLLENVTSKGLANKGHAYKAALNRNQAEGNDPDSGINMGLFTYPTLMAADILLYEAEQVPVGQDQKQHVEITRDIANAFNERARKNHSETQLILPSAIIETEGAVLPGLDGRKMSKSYKNTIPIFMDKTELRKIVNKIKTSSRELGEPVQNVDEEPIYKIYQAFANEEESASMRKGFTEGSLGYGDAKEMLFQKLEKVLSAPREKYNKLIKNDHYLEKVLADGATKAQRMATKTLEKVQKTLLGHSPSEHDRGQWSGSIRIRKGGGVRHC